MYISRILSGLDFKKMALNTPNMVLWGEVIGLHSTWNGSVLKLGVACSYYKSPFMYNEII